MGPSLRRWDLHDFPFDHQVLPVEIESLEFPSRRMVFSYPNLRDERGWTMPVKPEEVLGSSVRLPEWKIEAVQVRELDHYYKFEDASYSRCRIEILVSRRSGFYVWKVIVPDPAGLVPAVELCPDLPVDVGIGPRLLPAAERGGALS